jgi:hypothetical protein
MAKQKLTKASVGAPNLRVGDLVVLRVPGLKGPHSIKVIDFDGNGDVNLTFEDGNTQWYTKTAQVTVKRPS